MNGYKNIQRLNIRDYIMQNMIQNKKFQRKDFDLTADVISIKFNEDYRELLKKCKEVLEQPKDSTAIKQLMQIGAKVILDEKMTTILGVIHSNKRKNKRLGIIDFE